MIGDDDDLNVKTAINSHLVNVFIVFQFGELFGA